METENTEHKHEKVVTRDPQPDGSVVITTESYFEKLSFATKEIEKKLPTNKRDLLKDLVTCAEPLMHGALRVALEIETKHGEPVLITRRTLVSRERYGKR